MAATSKKPPARKRPPAKKTAIAKTKKPELAAVNTTPEAQVLGALVKQIESGKLKAGELSLVLDAQERVLDRAAKQAYANSMRMVQERMGTVVFDADNSQTHSSYATLEAINKKLVPIYTAEGFALSFGTDDSPLENHVRTTCDVMHSNGYSKSYRNDMPLDMVGIKGNENKTKIHGTGSALKYGRRYLTSMIFNVSTGDSDDDGNAAGTEPVELITIDQELVLEDLIKETGSDQIKFMQHCKIDCLANMPTNKYDHAVQILEQKRNQ